MGKNGGTDLLVEHDHGARVGSVLASWEGADGSLRVAGTVSNPEAIAQVRNGTLRGLSLGTSVIQDMTGAALLRTQDELSLCEAPKRGGCYIDTIDGATVRTVACASKRTGNTATAATLPHCHAASIAPYRSPRDARR